MIERRSGASGSDETTIQEWLRWLKLEPAGCHLGHRILFESQVHGGMVTVLEIRGVELTCEQQIKHLATMWN